MISFANLCVPSPLTLPDYARLKAAGNRAVLPGNVKNSEHLTLSSMENNADLNLVTVEQRERGKAEVILGILC